MSLAWTKSGEGNISFIANSKQYYITVDDKRYNRILEAIKDGATEQELIDLTDRVSVVRNHLFDNKTTSIKIEDGNVYFVDTDGEQESLHGVVVDRLMSFVDEGLPTGPLVNFITKCMENESKASSEELYDFLDHKGLPICEDGDFLAFKAISYDFKDKWTHKKDNSVGSIVKEKRRRVEDNRSICCAFGLHAGTLDYVNGYGNFRKDDEGNVLQDSDQCIIVKINPKDVVSVPSADIEKLRCCEYKVLKVYDGELNYHLVTNDGDEWEPDDDEEEWYDPTEENEFYDIEFTYDDATRHLRVEREDDRHVYGTLLEPEDCAGEYRCFFTDKMFNIEDKE